MYELDKIVREAVAQDVRKMADDPERPITIEGEVWVHRPHVGDDGESRDGQYLNMHPAVAAREMVNAVLDHQLVQLKLNESDEVWEALKWVLTHGKVPKHIPEEHALVLDLAQDAAAWSGMT